MYDLTEIDSGTEELKAALRGRLSGFSHALELMFLSERIDARRAETLGLANRVVPDTRLPEAVFTLANSLVQRDQRSPMPA
jgi:enoyl-CoA hydratase/carnithine racemase